MNGFTEKEAIGTGSELGKGEKSKVYVAEITVQRSSSAVLLGPCRGTQSQTTHQFYPIGTFASALPGQHLARTNACLVHSILTPLRPPYQTQTLLIALSFKNYTSEAEAMGREQGEPPF